MIFLFLEGFLFREIQILFAEVKEKTEKIRGVTKSLYDICKFEIHKDFLKLFYCQRAASRRREAARWQPNRAVRGCSRGTKHLESM